MAIKNNGNNQIRKLIKQWKKSEAAKYFGILLERLEDKFDTLAEGYMMFNERMTREFDAIHKRFNTIDLVLKEHSKILAEHTKMIDSILRYEK